MKNLIARSLIIGICVLGVHVAANAQQGIKQAGGSIAVAAAKTTAKVPVIIVGTAAKAGWEVTKFSTKVGWEVTKFGTKRVAAPIAKAVLVKGAPKAGLYLVKNTAMGAKYALPLALKLSIL